MPKRIALLLTAGVLTLAAGALAPTASDAAVSCSYSAVTHQVTITMTAVGDSAKVSAGGSAIAVDNNSCPGGPTVTNTTNILWTDTSPGATTAIVDLTGGPIGPGLNPKPGDPTPTIPMKFVGGTDFDTLKVIGTPQADSIAGGQGAVDRFVNLDVAAEPGAPDADVQLQSVEVLRLEGGDGADTLAGDGSGGTGTPLSNVNFDGGPQNDVLIGGNGSNQLTGGSGDDQLISTIGNSNAVIRPGTGNDTAAAAVNNADQVIYDDAPAGVNVDLSRSGPQDTGGSGVDTLSGFERVIGSGFADQLTGTEGNDLLMGGAGRDVLEGRGGSDELIGNVAIGDATGIDVASYAHPSAGVTSGVHVDLNAGINFQDTGSEGKDRLSGIADLVGSPFADTLVGDAQNNRIDAGAGADNVNAGDGADALFLRDGIGDTADCGTAGDTVDSDAAGVDTLTGCEQVTFSQGPPSGGGITPAGTGGSAGTADRALIFRFTAAARQRLGRRGTIVVSLTCPAESCRGRVTGTVEIRGRARGSRVRRLRAGSANVGLRAGSKRVLRFRLPAASARQIRAALRRGGRVTVQATAAATDAAGNRRTVTRRVIVRG